MRRIELYRVCVRQFCYIFWEPDPESCRELMDGSWFSALEALIQACDPALPDWEERIDDLKRYVSGFLDFEGLFQHLEEVYVSHFINSRYGIRSPLYHSCYSSAAGEGLGIMMGDPAVEMKERFEAAGLSLRKASNEPPDHLSLELEYLYFLLDGAVTRGRKDYEEEARQFALSFMLPWVQEFKRRLEEECHDPFYPVVTSLLTLLLEEAGR